mmetsp:Transcript_7301/g.6483  ORF Transcript_7301/g.6483 Transcript_7301/m.6483 type:complete len:122 (-) Transcript_7301:39-404(-)
MTDHIAMSKTTLPRMVKETLEKRLRLKQDRDTNFKYMVPTNFSKEETEVDKKLVIYVEDLHLPMKDQFGHQQASEVLRDYFNFGGWYTSKTKRFRPVYDLLFIAVLSGTHISWDQNNNVVN